MTVSSRIKGRYPQFGLEGEYENVEQHDAGGGEFRTGTENETEKGAKGRFDGGHGVFFRKDEFRDLAEGTADAGTRAWPAPLAEPGRTAIECEGDE